MLSKPLISIVIPVYNGANYMREAIDSALNQTYSNFEVIVVNDGSNDNGETEKIALSYGNKIRYFSKTNGGVATALNLAIKEMKGEYFSWLSHDDMYYPNKLEEQMNALEKCGDMKRIVYNDYDFLKEPENKIEHFSLSEVVPAKRLEDSVFPVLQILINGCAMLIHKSHFDRVGVFNEKLITTQDYDLWFRLLRGQKLLYLPKRLTVTRLHKGQGTNTLKCVPKERQELHIDFMRKMTEEEIIRMYGSKCNFYGKMSAFFKGANMEDAFLETCKKINDTEIPANFFNQVKELQDYLKGLSDNRAKKLYIFGTGKWGIELYYELSDRLIEVDGFCDNNLNKCGYVIDNRYCIPFDELKKQKEDVLVVVAVRAATEAIMNQLKDAGFKYITAKQEINKLFFDVPPVKWVSLLNCVKDVDYSSKGVGVLVSEFKKTIADVCKYYEKKLEDSKNN